MGGSLLLAVHCKKSDPVELKQAVLDYVTSTYGRTAAQDSSDDLTEVETLRAQVVNQPKISPGLRDTLAKYYRILCTMESRFPFSNAPGHVNVEFRWYDAFHPTKHSDQANIHFEKAAIVFSIGAAISQYALESDRRTEVGLNNAARLFQEAAGAFAHLKDAVAIKVDVPRPTDISPECAAMLERLMLAQAQECVLEKAVGGGKQPATLARLAKQVAIFYDDTSRLLSSKPLSDHFDRSWQSHAAAKSLLFHLEADLQNAAHLRADDFLKGVASEIAQLKSAKTSLEAAKKEAKYASKELQENVAEKERLVGERLTKAERENASVYLQRIPSAADLPGVVPACLVKSITPADVSSSVSTTPPNGMFKGVVPESTTRALSKYTDMVDSLIRVQTDALDGASDDARVKMREWELPEGLEALEPQGHRSASTLPDAVRVELEKVEAAGGAAHLQELVTQIRNIKTVTVAELDAGDAELAAEAREDDELRGHYGHRWQRPPSAQLTVQLRDKIKGYRGNLSAASDSDVKLETKLAAEAAAFGALNCESAAAGMPMLLSPLLSVDNMEPAAAVAALRTGMEGLSTLSSQRAALEQALRERKASDDVLPKLLSGGSGGNSSNLDALFTAELAKYDDLVQGVEENVKKQRQFLAAMAAANCTFRATYNFDGWQRQCEAAAQEIRVTLKKYHDVSSNLSEGVRFYTSLQEAVAAVRQQIGDYCVMRKLQRDELLEQLKAAAAAQEAAAAAHQLSGMTLNSQQYASTGGGGGGGGGAATAPPYAPPPPMQQQQQQQQYPQHSQQQPQQPQQPQWPPPTAPPGYFPPSAPQQQQQQQHQHYQHQQGQPPSWPPQPQPPQQQQQQYPPYPQQQQQQPPQQQGNPLQNFFGFGQH